MQSQADKNVDRIVLSLEERLETVLNADQMKKLKEFHSRRKKPGR